MGSISDRSGINLESVWIDMGSMSDRSEIDSDRYWLDLGSIWGPLVSLWDRSGIDLGSISDKGKGNRPMIWESHKLAASARRARADSVLKISVRI